MKLNYSKFKNIIFNNIALGDKKFSKEINIYSQSTDNSFKNKKMIFLSGKTWLMSLN